LQQWWGRAFREPLYEEWLQAAVLSRAIKSISAEGYALDADRFRAVSWKFRGWQWVDPTKEVEAYKAAVMAGFMSITQVIAQTGGGVDIEDVITERKRELQMFDDADIELDTTVPEVPEPVAAVPVTAAPAADTADAGDSEDAAAPARVINMRMSA